MVRDTRLARRCDWRHPLLGQTVAQMIAALPAEDVASVRHLPR